MQTDLPTAAAENKPARDCESQTDPVSIKAQAGSKERILMMTGSSTRASILSERFPGAPEPDIIEFNTPMEQRSLRVLLVDDHRDTLSILTRLLRSRGHQVDSAETGQDALRLLESHAYDVLVSDIGLPDVNGLELMRAARIRGSDVKGIALSGFGMDADITASMEAGYFAHLVKPVDWPKLDEAISRCT